MQTDLIKLIKQKEQELTKLSNEIEMLKLKLQNNVQEETSTQEKLEIYLNYFKGRKDIYSYLSLDKNNPNIKYYIPACLNEWKKGICNKTIKKSCKTCQNRKNKPLTTEVIKNHIYNNQTVGVYPMHEDETCYFLTLDFDDKKDENNIKEDVLAFVSICDKYNVPISIEKSRSGKGIHIWLFFKNKVKAINARKLGSLLLSKTMEIRDNLKIESFDRMFPNQDYLPKGGYGNLIALPFQTEPAKYGNTIFIDKNFIPIKGQFEYLKNLVKLTNDEVLERIKILSAETIDVSSQELNIKEEVKIKRKNSFKFPKEIEVILNDMIWC